MSIELGPAPSAGVQKSNEPSAGRARSKNDSANGGDATGGFAAMLSAADRPPAPAEASVAGNDRKPAQPDGQAGAKAAADANAAADADGRTAAKSDTAPAAQTEAVDPAAASALATKPSETDGDTATNPIAAAAPATDAVPQDAAALLAAFLPPTPALNLPLQVKADSATATGSPDGLVGELLATQGGGLGRISDKAGSGLAGAGDARALASSGTASAAASASASTLANYATVFEQLQTRLASGEVPSGDAASQPNGTLGNGLGNGRSAKPALAASATEARGDRLLQALQGGGSATPSADMAAMMSLQMDAANALKSGERFKGETGDAGQNPLAGGGLGHGNFTPTVQYDSATALSAASGTAAPGAAVADQVSYWISQGVQSAELTLDGLNSEKVKVHISMNGNEAHVEFRTDQAATREMLAGSAAQLKDLLSSQGVVLSGVSVGHSAADFSGGDGQSGRERSGGGQPGGRRGSEENLPRAAAPVSRAPAGTLDLFV